jgi:hypothetical protein
MCGYTNKNRFLLLRIWSDGDTNEDALYLLNLKHLASIGMTDPHRFLWGAILSLQFLCKRIGSLEGFASLLTH